MNEKSDAGRIQIKGLEDKPLLRSLAGRMKSAIEARLPGSAPAVPAEIFCAPPTQAPRGREKHFISLDFSEDRPITSVLFRGGGFREGMEDEIEASIIAGMSGAVRLLQANSGGRVIAVARRPDESDWEAILNSARNYLFIQWRIGAGGDAHILQAVPDVFFIALCERMFEPEMIEKFLADGLLDFSRMYECLEKAVGDEFPDGLPGLDFRIFHIFLGGQCAEVRWSMEFSDVFSLSAADVQLLIQEARKRGMYGCFISACSGCASADTGMARVLSRRGHDDFREEVSRLGAAPDAASCEDAEFEMLELALELYRDGKINPPPALKRKFDEAIAAHDSTWLFDNEKALADFVAVMEALPPRDMQLALSRLPRSLLSRAMRIESHMGLLKVYKSVRENASPKFWSELEEEISRAARGTAPESTKAALAARARLRIIDLVKRMAENKIISNAFRTADRDWMDDNMLKALIEPMA